MRSWRKVAIVAEPHRRWRGVLECDVFMSRLRWIVLFKSKVDTWLAVVLLGAAFLPVPATVVAYLIGAVDSTAVLVVAASMSVPSLMICWVFFGTFYFVDDAQLVVRSGPVRLNIAFETIRAVGLVRSIVAAPALSLDRVEIIFGEHKRVQISPDNRQAFIDAIKVRAPRASYAA